MQRRMTLLLVLVGLLSLGNIAFAQDVTHTVDFESAGVGADWNWIMAENADNPPMEFIANPVSGDINTSATVAQFIARADGNPWALVHTIDDGEFTFDAANSTIRIMVYKPVLSPVAFKVEGGTGAATELSVTNTLVNAWEELEFDFSALEGQMFSKIVIIPDNMARAQENILYLDNIQLPDGTVPPPLPEPVVAAPTPTIPEADVISIYSDAYTDVAGTNFNPGWGQSTVFSEVMVDGNNTLLYTGLNYQGTEYTAQDVSGMTSLHVDFWTANSTELHFFLISPGLETPFALPVVLEEWVSVDIPLSAFEAVDLTNVFQFKVTGNGTVYFDNLFFHPVADGPTEPVVAAPAPMHDAADVMSIYSGAYTDLAETNFNPNWGQSTAVTVDADVAGDATLLYESLNYQGTNLGGADGVDQDVSGYDFLHVDFWTANAPALNLFLISRNTGEQPFVLPITPGEWVSVEIPLTHFTDLGLGLTDIYQFKVDGGDGATSVWFDNWYFYTADVGPEAPVVAAPTPTVPAEEVLSIYSGAYTDLAETNFNPNWGQSTAVTVDADVAGDATLLYETLNYQGTNLGGPDGVDQDLSGYGFLHVDFWTSNAPALNLFLISRNTGEQPFALPIVPGEWVSVDIPLNHFTDLGMSLTDIFQFKVDGGDGATTVWFDNWFFHGEPMVEPVPGLFISEYAEGSSNNKYLEIYNPTDVAIDLGAYSISSCSNGCDSTGVFDYPNNIAFEPGTMLEPGEVYVIGHPSANAEILAESDQTFTYLSNGDDVFALTDTMNLHIIDIIGDMGPDPGDGWDVAGVLTATKDHTLIRKNDVMYGNIGNWEMSAGTDSLNSQWIVAERPTADYTPATLGWHMMPPPPPAPLVAAPPAIHDAADVMSIYSAAYDDLAETNFNPNWGQSTLVTLHADVVGDTTHLLYESLNYQGTNLGGPDGVDQDVSGYQFLHIDFWTSNAPALNFFLISRGTGEHAFALPIVPGEWVSLDIPLDYFTDLGLSLTDIFQFKVDGGDGATNVWFDNWYFHTPVPPPPPPIELAGAWVMAPQAGALAVGPNPFDGSWWSSSDEDVLTRACFFDDKYVFNADGSFHNALDGETWLETWQGVEADGCGAPVAPHDGMTPATWSVDPATRTVTLNGVGAYLGIPKAYNGGELANPGDAPASITYEVHVNDTSRTIQLVLDIGGGYWTYTMVPAPLPPIDLEGAWVMAPMAGALAVGPNPFDGSWWSSSDEDVLTRACFFDDKYVFNADGSFQNVMDGETWLETWQGVDADGCGAPIAPHDGMTPANWSVDPEARTVTVEGVGSYLGIPKAFNGGELGNPADAPASITYEVHLGDTAGVISLVLDIGGGFWTFKMVPAPILPPPVPLVAAPTPDMDETEVFSIFSNAYTDLAETNFNPNWGQTTQVMTVDILGDSTLAYMHLNYQGTNLGGPEGVDQDVSGYDFLHVDLWTANATELNFFLISRSSGEHGYSLPITPQEWVSVDIPLSFYTDLGMTLTDIFQFKVDGGNGETMVWFDNWFFHTLNHTGIDENLLPEEFALNQNYPNPFNPSTTINYSIVEAGHVTLKLYNITGQEVVTLVDGDVSPGYYSMHFDASNLATGTYFYALTAGKQRSVKKMVLIK